MQNDDDKEVSKNLHLLLTLCLLLYIVSSRKFQT